MVTQEAGGTEIETLFVDEGFGTLDADTLDDVMDRLDGASAPPVAAPSAWSATSAELRDRIPPQVHVRKSIRFVDRRHHAGRLTVAAGPSAGSASVGVRGSG